jgi:hypothetical protein
MCMEKVCVHVPLLLPSRGQVLRVSTRHQFVDPLSLPPTPNVLSARVLSGCCRHVVCEDEN